MKQHQPLWDRVVGKTTALQRLYAAETSARERLRLLRTETPWCNIFAEFLYRGEHLAARQAGEPAPSEAAYRKAADCLMMTPDLLKKICQTVRDDRHASGEPPEGKLLIADFEQWKVTGAFPEHLEDA